MNANEREGIIRSLGEDYTLLFPSLFVHRTGEIFSATSLPFFFLDVSTFRSCNEDRNITRYVDVP